MTLQRSYADDMAPGGWAQRPYLAFRSAPDRRRHPRGRTARCGRNAAGRRDVGRGHVLVGGGVAMVDRAGMRALPVRATSIRGSKPSKATCPRSSRNARDRRASVRDWRPHAAYTCSAENLRRGMEACRRYGIPMTTHIAETLGRGAHDPRALRRDARGVSDSLGVLDGGADRRTLRAPDRRGSPHPARAGVHVAHCPTSNMKIASGVAPIERLRTEGGELHGGHRRPQFEQRSGHVGGDAQRFVPAKGDDDGSLCRAGSRTAPHGDGLRCGRHRPCRRVRRGEGRVRWPIWYCSRRRGLIIIRSTTS